MSDTSSLLLWWFFITAIGVIFTPLTTYVFSRFIDRGYIFSKVIGIFLSSYLIWLLASLHVLPFSKITIAVSLIAWLLANMWFLRGKTRSILKKLPWRYIILEESLFFICLVLWSYIRAHEPSIRGLEKFMDYGFMNSILRSDFFPPLDMWLAKSPDYAGGFQINYYYFGHYIAAFLTKLSGINSAITYNLMIATEGAFTASLAFSLGANLVHQFYQKHVKILLAGLLAAFLVGFGGNLHPIYTLTEGYPNEEPAAPWQLTWGFHPERYWYPNATRFIPFTIHEFPIYSFVVADLHGHVSDIPFVLFGLALLLHLVISHKDRLKQLESSPIKPASGSAIGNFIKEFQQQTALPFEFIILYGVLLAVMYMTNAWDGVIYLMAAGLTIFYLNVQRKKYDSAFNWLSVIYKSASAGLFLIFFFLLAGLPFFLNFKPFVSGIGVLCAPAFLLGKHIGPLLFEEGKCQKSAWWMLMILWGFFYFNVIAFIIFILFPRLKSFLVNTKKSYLDHLQPTDMFVVILIALSTFLLVFPEFFYIKDIYPAHYRANTMFKLGYQAFMMLGIVSSYIFMRIKLQKDIKKNIGGWIYHILFIVLFGFVFIYPYFAINSYYGNLTTYRGLDGLQWMAEQYQDDYQAIEWIRNNVICTSSLQCNTHPVLVEANGDSYTDYDRVSAYTGLPTIVGWPVHEWLWRGSYDEAGKRIPEVAAIYEGKDIEATKKILKKYNVEYIFVGQLEREKYKALNEDQIAQLGKVVFGSGSTKIYKVNVLN